jgi:hypothetical protein
MKQPTADNVVALVLKQAESSAENIVQSLYIIIIKVRKLNQKKLNK